MQVLLFRPTFGPSIEDTMFRQMLGLEHVTGDNPYIFNVT